MAILTGMRSALAVTSSWAVIWKHPSPSTAHTIASGRPTLAPMAAGTAKPMVPSPPELTQVFGLLEAPVLRRPHLVLTHARKRGSCRRGVASRRVSRTNCGLSDRRAGRTRDRWTSAPSRLGRS